MSMLETGITGAKRISWERDNSRDLLLRLMEEYPNADEDTLVRHMRDALEDNEPCLLTLILYFIHNHLRSLKRRAGGDESEQSEADRIAAAEALKAEIKSAIVKRVLLELEMPNGKPLRDCTGADCLRFGGWLTAVGKKVGADQMVGKRLTEAQVRKLFSKHAVVAE